MATSFSKVVQFNQNAGGWNINILGTSTSTVTFNDGGSFSGVWSVLSDCWFTAIDADGKIIMDEFGQPLNRWYMQDNGGGNFTGSGDQYSFTGMASDGVTSITGTGAFSNNRTVVSETITLGIPGVGNVLGTGSGFYDMDVIGDGSDNTLSGNTGFDNIQGGGGNDTIAGEVGNDRLQGDEGNDTLVGGEGDDILVGGEGDDALYIEEGEDWAYGDAGTDTAYLDGELSDYIVYTFTASAPVEASVTAVSSKAMSSQFIQLLDKEGKAYTFTGVENVVFSKSNQTVATNTNGLLKGASTDKKDTINGTAQADYLFAGAGDDKVLGKEGADEIDGGTGKDTLDGGFGNDRLDGGAGDDTLTGGAGNDSFIVDSAKDKVTEKANEGIDTVYSTASFTLSANVENLSLLGQINAINATGNATANTLVGNDAKNTINGGLGNDTLTGGAGADTFVFNSKLGATNVDSITDFVSGIDKIALDDAVFSKLKGVKDLSSTLYTQRIVGVSTQDANDYLVYDFESGRLFYDADGSGTKSAAVLIATVGSATDLSASDFVVV